MRIDLLKRSCKRLPQLIESGAPACLITMELQILMNFGFDAIRESQKKDTRRELELRQLLIAAEAAGGG